MKNSNIAIFSAMCSSIHILRNLVDIALERSTQPYGVFAVTSATSYARKVFETYSQFPGMDVSKLEHAIIHFRKDFVHRKSLADALAAYDDGYQHKLQQLKDNPECKFPAVDFACIMQCLANEVIQQLITLKDAIKEDKKAAKEMVASMQSQKGTIVSGA